MRAFYTCFIALLATLCLAGCRGDMPKRMPDTIPDIHGYIKDLKRTAGNGKAVVVLLQPIEELSPADKQASIKIDKSTLIEDDKGKAMTIEQLREGHEIQAWLEGDLPEPRSLRGIAKALRVVN